MTFADVNKNIYQTQEQIKDLIKQRSDALDRYCLSQRGTDEYEKLTAQTEYESVNTKILIATRELQQLEELRESFYKEAKK